MENQAITQRPNERDIQKRFNSRNAISSGILIVIGVFMVSLTLTMHTTDSNILSLVLMVCGGSMAIYGMIRILSHAIYTIHRNILILCNISLVPMGFPNVFR